MERLSELFFVWKSAVVVRVAVNKKSECESPARRETPGLKSFVFIESVGAMPATAAAAIAAFEVVALGETFVAFGCEIKIFAF